MKPQIGIASSVTLHLSLTLEDGTVAESTFGEDPLRFTMGDGTLVHGLATVRAVENALNYELPPNAHLIRNLMLGAQYVHDHVMHFYHLHALDWVDVVSALGADPKATSELAQSLSNYPKSSPGYFSDVKKRVTKFVESGQLGIFPRSP